MGRDKLDEQIYAFIKTVASSNLETFHSKCIEWVINQIHPQAKFFNELIGVKNKNVIHRGTISEYGNHDLITVIEVDGVTHLVFWENKIKADFSNKSIKDIEELAKKSEHSERLGLLLDKYKMFSDRGVSQPFWYQLRWLLWDEIKKKNFLSKIYSQRLNYPSEKLLKKGEIRTHWVVLSTYTKPELEVFHQLEWDGLNKDWYLGGDSQIKGDKQLVQEVGIIMGQSVSKWRFLKYPDNGNSESMLFKGNYLVNNEVLIKNPLVDSYIRYLESLSNSQEIIKKNFEVNNLLKLQKELNERIKDYKFEYEWQISGSERAGNALLNIYFNPKHFLKNDSMFKNVINGKKWSSLEYVKSFKYSKIDYIKWTVQIQGDAVKLQFAHAAYHSVKLANADKYLEEVVNSIQNDFPKCFQDDKFRNSNLKRRAEYTIEQILNKETKRFKVKTNKPNTKTGLSFTIQESDSLNPEKTEKIGFKKIDIKTSLEPVITICRNISDFLKKG